MILNDTFFLVLFWTLVGFCFFSSLALFLFKTKKKTFAKLPRHFQIKNLLVISLLSATSVAVLFFLSRFSSIIVLPNVRTAFEGVLVKISGFVFGPIIGIISALVTELLVYFFIPTYFHYKFLILLVCFGAFAGLVRYLLFFKINNRNYQILIGYFGLIFFFVSTQFFFHYSSQAEGIGLDHFWTNLKTNYLLAGNFKSLVFYGNLLAFFVLFALMTIFTLIFNLKKNYFKKIINKKTAQNVLPIFIFAIFAEYFISVAIGSHANQSVFGESGKSGFILFTSAVFIAPFKIIINTFIIFNVWKAIRGHFNKRTFFL